MSSPKIPGTIAVASDSRIEVFEARQVDAVQRGVELLNVNLPVVESWKAPIGDRDGGRDQAEGDVDAERHDAEPPSAPRRAAGGEPGRAGPRSRAVPGAAAAAVVLPAIG